MNLSSFCHTVKRFHLFLPGNTQLNVKTVPFQTIPFNISTQFVFFAYTKCFVEIHFFCLHTVK